MVYPQNILWRNTTLLAVLIAELNGIRAVLVDDDGYIQSASPRTKPGDWAKNNQD